MESKENKMCREKLEQEYKEMEDSLPNAEKAAEIISGFVLFQQEEV